MSFSSRLKERRENLNLSRAEFAKKIGVTASAISNYENDVSSPKADLLFGIFEALQCDANYLYQDDINISYEFKATLKEQEHIKKYRNLDDYGKKQVDTTLENEYSRCTSESDGKEFHDYDNAYDYLTQSQMFAMGGLDIESMENDELIDFANDMYEMDKKAAKYFK